MASELTINKRRIALWARRVLYGALVCIFSLNGVLRLTANQLADTTTLSIVLKAVASVPELLYLRIPGGQFFLFELVFRWVLILFAAYVVLLLIASVRHRSAVIAAAGMLGLLIGLFALTWLSILVLIIVLLFTLLGWIVGAVQYVIGAVFSFLLWRPVFYTILSIVAIALLAGLITLVKGLSVGELWRSFKEWLRSFSAKPIVLLFVLLIIGTLIWFVGVPLWEYYIEPILMLIRNWLLQYVVPIISWIGSVVLLLLLGAIIISLVLVILATLGWQFAEQFLSARFCGRNTHISFESGFAIGAAMGLTLLVCSANPIFTELVNVSWSDTSPFLTSINLSGAVYSLMPARAELLLHTAFANASLPIFDLGCLLVALLIANCSLITSLLSTVTIEPVRELFSRDRLPPLGKVLFGFLIMCWVAVVGSFASEDA